MEGIFAHLGYAAVLAALVVAGVGVPIPEELTQLVAGALSHDGVLELRFAIPVVWVGIVAGDALLFAVARRAGPSVLAWRPVARHLGPSRREKLEGHFARHAFLTVAVARHMGGVRFPVFALAALSGVRLATFVAADGLSAALSVPLVVGAGWVSWHHLSEARREIRIAEVAVLAAVALGVAVAVALRRRRRSPPDRA